jgi:nucleoside-diphosphate-sugar epimerase
MKVLVTGSSGLVGESLVEALRNANIDVVPFDMRHDGADIRNITAVGDAISGCDGVIHLAAISRVAWGEADPALCHEVNAAGTQIVVDAALTAASRPWLILASSREVYGSLESLPARESDRLRPVNAYGRSKLASERIVKKAQRLGLRAAILRLSNVYGTTNDHPDRAVPSLLWRAMSGQELRISGAETYFDFVHVDDCVRGFMSALDRLDYGLSVPTVHLVSGVATSLGQLALEAIRVSQSLSELVVLPARSFDVPGFVGNPAFALKALGWHAKISLSEGMEGLRDALSLRARPMDDVFMPLPATVLAAPPIIGLEPRGQAS